MKANQSFCCGFCFEGSSRDELSTISYLTMKGCVVSACDFQTGYFRRRVFGEERHSCDFGRFRNRSALQPFSTLNLEMIMSVNAGLLAF